MKVGRIMNKEQAEVLNIVQQVMRGVVSSIQVTHPERTAELSTSLAAFCN
jgi:predicted amino acid-binding ACT domain protein